MRADPAKRLTIPSDTERLALYGLPDFDEFQRAEHFALDEAELRLVLARRGTLEQVRCLLQLGYFKAKRAFFGFAWAAVPAEGLAFVLSRCFPGVALNPHPLRGHEAYAQRRAIAGHFGFRLWAALDLAGQRLCGKPASPLALHWRTVDGQAGRFKRNLRPLCLALAFASATAESPWRAALAWLGRVFARQQTLAARPPGECPAGAIPKRLRPHLWAFDAAGNATGLLGDRYEFWIYRQVRKRFESGELYLDDSLRHRRLSDELVTPERQREVVEGLGLAWLRDPIDATLDRLLDELRDLWRAFDKELRSGQLKHLDYDPDRKRLAWRRPKADPESTPEAGLLARLPTRSIADIFRFVNGRCQFLAALTPLQPRYAKQVADPDSLMAVILAQAMNHGNPRMAETSDIPYHVLEATHQQYLRLSTLRAANDRISHAIAGLSIFPHYSFDLEVLYGGVDGQKFEAASPTVKARHSRKYFGTGKGVVAYTLLANHVPLHSAVIGAHEHESHYVFDACYHNTSDILPTAITGDMHSLNKATTPNQSGTACNWRPASRTYRPS